MSDKIIVLVSDRGDGNHGEISVLDDAHEAEQLMETLLEAGFEQERIQVFSGSETEFEVSSRPMVALVAEGEEVQPSRPVVIPEREAASSGPSRNQKAGDDNGAQLEDEAKEDAVEAEESKEEETPVRFSSLFRSA